MLEHNEPDLISGVSIRSEAIDGTSDVFSTGDDDRGQSKCRDHVAPTKLVNEIISARLTDNRSRQYQNQNPSKFLSKMAISGS